MSIIVCGGSWLNIPELIRSDTRYRCGRDYPFSLHGFRLVAEPKDPRFCVIRGGSWLYKPWNLRSALRFRLEPDDRDDFLGFRLIAESKS